MLLKIPNHVSFIMDGNGRWATQKGKERIYGHKQGIKKIKILCDWFLKCKIPNISFFAFSIDNFSRPKKEVDYLMNLIKVNFNNEYINDLIKKSIKFVWIGFKEKLDYEIIEYLLLIEEKTKECQNLTIYFFFNYGFSKELEEALKGQKMITEGIPPIDLLIRTSGEKRISNYCMNLIRYSEIIFEKTLWPDYDTDVFKENIEEYFTRERRFGNVIKSTN